MTYLGDNLINYLLHMIAKSFFFKNWIFSITKANNIPRIKFKFIYLKLIYI